MNKREFLKAGGMAVAGSMMPEMGMAEKRPEATRKNWAGNLTYSTDNLDMPGDVAGVQKAVEGQAKLRALGARHSFNSIADSTEDQVQMRKMDAIELDAAAKTVTVGPGVTYGALAPYIDKRGFAVHNMASLPHISVVGAVQTGTHGSGVKNGNLSTAVRGFDAVTADGKMVHFSRETMGDAFAGAVVGLGALGVITRMTLDVVPRFDMTQVVYLGLSFDQLAKHFREIFGAGYSLSLFTDWQNNQATQVWIKRKVGDVPESQVLAPDFYGAKLATRKMHPLLNMPSQNTTDQGGVPGPWYERLPHFKMEFTPSSGEELQTEYFVPLARGYEAIRAVETLKDQITPHLFVTEFRTIAADDLWLSMAYRQDSLALHFTWKPEWEAVRKILPQIEAKLEPFGARPHWGKLFTLAPGTLQSRYPRMGDYKGLLAKMDPGGKFRNAFMDRNVFG